MKVSVIVPVYNVEKYINECISSLIAQKYSDFEIILVDDGSPDNCGKICDEYVVKDNRIRVIHQKNRGVSAARNAGMRIAKGKYITFVDADDWVEPNYLSVLTEYMQPMGMTVSSFIREDNQFSREMKFPNFDNKKTNKIGREILQISILRMDGIYGYVWGKMFDKDLILNHDLKFCESIKIREDHLFCIQYTQHIESAMLINEGTYHYRSNPESALGQLEKMIYKEQDDYNLSSIRVVEKERMILQGSKEALEVLNGIEVVEKRNALYRMTRNRCASFPEYKAYLHDIRNMFFTYLKIDIGELKIDRIKTFLCCIHPQVQYFFALLWKKVKNN